MSGSHRLIDGTVIRLQCGTCGAVFPHFRFAGETDSVTDGLYSATSCTANQLPIVSPVCYADGTLIGLTGFGACV